MKWRRKRGEDEGTGRWRIIIKEEEKKFQNID